MKIDICGYDSEQGRVLVVMNPEELLGYGVSFGKMSLSDEPTRVMLRDMLTVIEHLGLWHRGERITIDCALTDNGGCALLFAVFHKPQPMPDSTNTPTGTQYRFASCDDIIAAQNCGALKNADAYISKQDSGEWLLTALSPLSAHDDALLREFCLHDDAEDDAI